MYLGCIRMMVRLGYPDLPVPWGHQPGTRRAGLIQSSFGKTGTIKNIILSPTSSCSVRHIARTARQRTRPITRRWGCGSQGGMALS
jgi:hypothetical protein